MVNCGGEPRTEEPLLERDDAELLPLTGQGPVRRAGHVRLPLVPELGPRATLYRLPSGSLVWCVRVRWLDRTQVRWCSTETLREYAERHRLRDLRVRIDRLVSLVRRGVDAAR